MTVFAPTRTFSGPLRFAYLEYASHLISFLGPVVTTVLGTLQSLPTLAVPALFFIPMLPVLCFFSLPALPLAWHYIAFHYRHRLNAVQTSASKTTALLDLAVVHARRATAFAHVYEKKALDTVSTTRRTASLTLMLHCTDFFDTSVSAWAAMGHTTACVEDLVTASSEVVRLANNLQHLDSGGDDDESEGGPEILLEQANNATSGASETLRLARQAQESVKRSQEAKIQAQKAREEVQSEAERVRVLGAELARKVVGMEAEVANIEREVEGARAVLEQAVMVAIGGEMSAAEGLVANAERSLATAIQQADGLSSVADEARRGWVEIAVDA